MYKIFNLFTTLALCSVLSSVDTNAIQGLEYVESKILANDTICPFQTTFADGTAVAEGTCTNITQNIRNFRKSNFNVEKDKIYEVQFQIEQFGSTAGNTVYPYFRFPQQINTDFQIVGVGYYETGEAMNYCGIVTSQVCNIATGIASYSGNYSVFVQALKDSDFLRIGASSAGVIIQRNDSNSAYPIRFNPIVNVYTRGSSSAMNEKDDEDRDNIEQQSSTASSDSDSSAQDAEQTGTTLLGAFSAFVNALTNASPSNCVLDMDLGNLDMGNVDLCQLSPPAGFQAIASVFMILFCVPLSIATARKLISLFRSFQ